MEVIQTKVVILCGGYGTRLGEETVVKPKPMVEIGGIPMLKHIMDFYSMYGHHEFYLPLGYKGDKIKKYFLNYQYLNNDLTIHANNGTVDVMREVYEEWTVHLIDTGLNTMTGGRLHRLKSQLSKDTFMVTYGDGLSDVNLNEVLNFHQSHGKIATVTAVRNMSSFGMMKVLGNRVMEFKEKPPLDKGFINGGFFVFEPEIFDYIAGDDTILESETLEKVSRDGQLMAYLHEGFWQCMDTLKDKLLLEKMWNEGHVPWKQLKTINNQEVG